MNYFEGIKENIAQSTTIKGAFYDDDLMFEKQKEAIFEKSWQFIDKEENVLSGNQNLHAFTLLEKFLELPLLLSKDENETLRCLSNVCTHRGFIMQNHNTKAKKIVCQYHGRRFNLDGSFNFMPEFKSAENFPCKEDNLANLPLKKWKNFLFTSLQPAFDFDEFEKHLTKYVGFLPIENFSFNKSLSQDYLVHANWALYCDNYLEGFHIPFVHNQLNEILDYGKYTTTLFNYCNLQTGYSSSGTAHFNLPDDHPYFGENVTAFYFWLFPNIMLNFYPWGLSINVVSPLHKNLTKVKFLTYLYDENLFEEMNAAYLTNKVEKEDEFVVEAVHKGLKSKLYKHGRFSPTREKGVHHFHCLLKKYLNH